MTISDGGYAYENGATRLSNRIWTGTGSRSLAENETVANSAAEGDPAAIAVPLNAAFGLGDINGDGRNGNDLIYVPRDAHDPNEIQFRTIGTGATAVTAQAQADACVCARAGPYRAKLSPYCVIDLDHVAPFVRDVFLHLFWSVPVVVKRKALLPLAQEAA